jgi:hypothetical protein
LTHNAIVSFPKIIILDIPIYLRLHLYLLEEI